MVLAWLGAGALAQACPDGDGDGICDAADACVGPGDGLSRFAGSVAAPYPSLYLYPSISADLDGDGLVDLLGGGPTWIRNLGNGSFAPPVNLDRYVGPLATADLDGDGDLDVLNASSSSVRW